MILTLGKLSGLQEHFGPAAKEFDCENWEHCLRALAIYLDTTPEFLLTVPVAQLEIAAQDLIEDLAELVRPR